MEMFIDLVLFHTNDYNHTYITQLRLVNETCSLCVDTYIENTATTNMHTLTAFDSSNHSLCTVQTMFSFVICFE